MSKQKILITGSNGLLGQKLVKLFVKNDFDVIAFSRGRNKNNVIRGCEYHNVNITNFDFVSRFIYKAKPNFIINAAALTNVDNCELRRRECEEINLRAVKNLTSICKKECIHLIQISTDFIFDGKNGPYLEKAKPNPLNNYGMCKWKSEKFIQRANIDFTILRTILVYGLSNDPNRSNIVLWVKKSLELNKKINVITDQYRMPTYNVDLAAACLSVVQKKATGIFNISSNELLSIYEIANQIADVFELDKNLINPITTKQLNQRADRPEKTGFVIDKAISELGFINANFKERLLVFKEELNSQKSFKK